MGTGAAPADRQTSWKSSTGRVTWPCTTWVPTPPLPDQRAPFDEFGERAADGRALPNHRGRRATFANVGSQPNDRMATGPAARSGLSAKHGSHQWILSGAGPVGDFRSLDTLTETGNRVDGRVRCTGGGPVGRWGGVLQWLTVGAAWCCSGCAAAPNPVAHGHDELLFQGRVSQGSPVRRSRCRRRRCSGRRYRGRFRGCGRCLW